MRYIAIILVFLSLFSGCGYKEGVKTAAAKSYIYFTGDASGVFVSVNKGEKFAIKSDEKEHQYALKPGKHLIEVYKEKVLVLKREVFLSDGVAKEIELY